MQLNLFDTDLAWRRKQDFKIIKELGDNEDSRVLLVNDTKRDNEEVVLTIIKFGTDYCIKNPGRLKKAIELYQSLNHESLLKVYDYYEEFDFVAYTSPYIKGKKLSELIKTNKFSLDEINYIVSKLISAAECISKYRDPLTRYESDEINLKLGVITAEDIIISESGIPVIFDFQIARKIGVSYCKYESKVTNPAENFAYDLLDNPNRSVCLDTHAIGVILWELLAERRRIDDMEPLSKDGPHTNYEIFSWIYNKRKEENFMPPALKLEAYSNKYNSILNRLLHLDLKKRYKTAYEVISDLNKKEEFKKVFPRSKKVLPAELSDANSSKAVLFNCCIFFCLLAVMFFIVQTLPKESVSETSGQQNLRQYIFHG